MRSVMRILWSIALALALACLPVGCSLFNKKEPQPAGTTATAQTPSLLRPLPMPTPAPTPAQAPKVKKPFLAQVFSCFGLLDKLFPKKKEPPKAEPAQLIGTVKMVNLDDKFVLIDALVYTPGAPGESLVCIANQRESASLHISPFRKPPFLIADIVSGTPSVGDRVYKP